MYFHDFLYDVADGLHVRKCAHTNDIRMFGEVWTGPAAAAVVVVLGQPKDCPPATKFAAAAWISTPRQHWVSFQSRLSPQPQRHVSLDAQYCGLRATPLDWRITGATIHRRVFRALLP